MRIFIEWNDVWLLKTVVITQRSIVVCDLEYWAVSWYNEFGDIQNFIPRFQLQIWVPTRLLPNVRVSQICFAEEQVALNDDKIETWKDKNLRRFVTTIPVTTTVSFSWTFFTTTLKSWFVCPGVYRISTLVEITNGRSACKKCY